MEQTLLNLFEKEESNFYSELSKMVLPRDEQKLKNFLNDFFVDKVSVEEYKKELTIGEVAMLNSVLKLFPFQMPLFKSSGVSLTARKVDSFADDDMLSKDTLTTLGYTGVGGVIGTILFKQTWGGVLLTVAACALGLYMNKRGRPGKEEHVQMKIDVSKYIETLKNICGGIDEVISNYRASINNVKKSYESQAPVTLATKYGPLLDRFASMYVALKGMSVPKDVQEEINKLYKTLKNYHYEIVDYSDSTSQFYEIIDSENITECTLLKAAILEDDHLLIKGECLMPIKK